MEIVRGHRELVLPGVRVLLRRDAQFEIHVRDVLLAVVEALFAHHGLSNGGKGPVASQHEIGLFLDGFAAAGTPTN